MPLLNLQNEEPKWLTSEMVAAIHEAQLIRYGGRWGVRDVTVLGSVLQRPRAKWVEQSADLAALAAALGHGLATNRPFVDGNERTALMAIFTFLGLNGVGFHVPEADFAVMILALCAGEVSEGSLARWIRDNWPSA